MLEAHVEEARKRMLQMELLKQVDIRNCIADCSVLDCRLLKQENYQGKGVGNCFKI